MPDLDIDELTGGKEAVVFNRITQEIKDESLTVCGCGVRYGNDPWGGVPHKETHITYTAMTVKKR